MKNNKEYIIITSNETDSDKFNQIKYECSELIKKAIDMECYGFASTHANELDFYTDYFYLLQKHFKDKQMIFTLTKGEYMNNYCLENEKEWKNIYKSHYYDN